jgi:hypothetical protein
VPLEFPQAVILARWVCITYAGHPFLRLVAIGETIIMKRLASVTFEEVSIPIWRAVNEMGLSGEEVDEFIEEAKAEARVASYLS